MSQPAEQVQYTVQMSGGHSTQVLVYRHPFCKQLDLLCNLFGVIAAIGLWVVGILTLFKISLGSLFMSVCLLLMAIPVSLLELNYMVTKCACCSADSCFWSLWRAVAWFDSWKRGILYILLAIAAFLFCISGILALLCGICLLLAGICYFCKPFQYKKASGTVMVSRA